MPMEPPPESASGARVAVPTAEASPGLGQAGEDRRLLGVSSCQSGWGQIKPSSWGQIELTHTASRRVPATNRSATAWRPEEQRRRRWRGVRAGSLAVRHARRRVGPSPCQQQLARRLRQSCTRGRQPCGSACPSSRLGQFGPGGLIGNCQCSALPCSPVAEDALLARHGDWQARGACRSVDPELFFSPDADRGPGARPGRTRPSGSAGGVRWCGTAPGTRSPAESATACGVA
jgi:hypothetical protein